MAVGNSNFCTRQNPLEPTSSASVVTEFLTLKLRTSGEALICNTGEF